MAGNGGEIKVVPAELERCEKAMQDLSRVVTNKKCAITVVNSKGRVAEELINAATSLNSLGRELAAVIHKTQNKVTDIRVKFVEVDQQLKW